MNRVTIDSGVCKGCSLCISVCPKKILVINKDFVNEKGYNPSSVIDMEPCIACGMCAIMCPESAIKVEKE